LKNSQKNACLLNFPTFLKFISCLWYSNPHQIKLPKELFLIIFLNCSVIEKCRSRGQSLVVWAIAEGREAAISVDRFLQASVE